MTDLAALRPRGFEPERMVLGLTVSAGSPDGGARVSIPVRTSEGRCGFGPALALVHGGAQVNGPFGLGWSLSGVDSAARDAGWRLPLYADGQDRFHLGGRDIVPALGPGGAPLTETRDGFRIERWRERVALTHERVERWVEIATGADHWRLHSRDGTVSIYGQQARLADPAAPERTAEWLLERRHHPDGDAMEVDWKPEDLTGVDTLTTFEATRADPAMQAMRYPKRIRYGANQPWGASEPRPAGLGWLFEAVFDYGEHEDGADGLPQSAESLDWELRDDSHSNYRYGFEIRTRRLCRRVLMFHRLAELGPDPVCVGATELAHTRDPGGAVLTGARYVGYRRGEAGNPAATRATPQATFQYAAPEIGDGFLPGPQVTEGGLSGAISRQSYTFIDLFGEGVPGLLSRDNGAWLWQENLGGGRFAAPRTLAETPKIAAIAGALGDADGDGRAEMRSVIGRDAGQWTLGTAPGRDGWQPHTALAAQPRVDFGGGRIQFADLTGDGYDDLLADCGTYFDWYEADGGTGYRPARRIPKPSLPTGGPAGFSTATKGYFWGDMVGDGLADLVRIDPGQVTYWPHLGQGRFAAPVVLDTPPALPMPLDNARLHLVDLTLNGRSDIVYVGDGELLIWHNLSGNRFSDLRRLRGLPRVGDLSLLRILDLSGDGRPALVWRNAAPAGADAPIQYLPLLGAVRPGLMTGARTGTGLVHRLDWGWSGADYLAAKAGDRPWATRLPSHRPVIRQLTGEDLVSGQMRASLFQWRDGAFDHDDRRFVGFGLGETLDQIIDEATTDRAPPRLTRCWTHIGPDQPPVPDGAWTGDPGTPAPPPLVIEEAADLPTADLAEAARAVAGLVLRREVYACTPDGTPAPEPLTVMHHGYRVVRLQPGQGDVYRAVMMPLDAETLSAVYEDDTADPRIAHALTLTRSPTGASELLVEIAYPRRPGPAREAGQAVARVRATTRRHATVDDARGFLPDILLERLHHDLTGLTVGPEPLSYDDAAAQVIAALSAPAAFGAPAPAGPAARPVGRMALRYWNEAGTATAPGAALPFPARHCRSDAAILPRALFDTLYAPLGPTGALIADAGLIEADGFVWAPGAETDYGPRAEFHRARQVRSRDGGTVTIDWRPDRLAILSQTAPTGAMAQGTLDPLSLAYRSIEDQNGTLAETAYDPLGLPARVGLRGTEMAVDGREHPAGSDPLAFAADPLGGLDLDAALADPAGAVGRVASVTLYDAGAEAETLRVLRISRDAPFHDGRGGTVEQSPMEVTLDHFSGQGQGLQRKLRVEPGPAIVRGPGGAIAAGPDGRPAEAEATERWLGSGLTEEAPNGLDLARYAPFFSASAAFEDDALLRDAAVAPQLTWDSMGRVVRVDHPDGTHSRSVYGAWATLDYDRNDTIVGTPYEAARAALPVADPRRAALDQARSHSDTPLERRFDPMGHTQRTVEHAPGGGTRETVGLTDPGLGESSLTDPRGLVHRQTYDMTGRVIRTDNPDAGETLTLYRHNGQPLVGRDAVGRQTRFAYDAGGRRVSTLATVPGQPDRTVERIVYGDDPGVANAAARNLLGRPFAVLDDAGRHETPRRSLTGRALEERRWFLADHRAAADWAANPSPALEAERFVTLRRLDAMGRAVRLVRADGTAVDTVYGRRNEPTRVTVTTADGAMVKAPVLVGQRHGARGERLAAELGNGIVLSQSADPATGRVIRAEARPAAGGAALQDYRYEFDPVGNLIEVDDVAAPPGLNGMTASARRSYRHDAFYRLIRAEGRVHRALQIGDYRNGLDDGQATKSTRHITLDNAAEIERYTRHFDYDDGDNLTRIRHVGDTLTWTRDIWVSPTSNRALPALDLNDLPVAALESAFSAAGEIERMPHLEAMEWTWQGRLGRAVIVGRGGPGSDDAEIYHYDHGGRRLRRVLDRLTAAGMEIADVRFLPGCQIHRVRREAGATVLARTTCDIAGAGETFARLHQWTVDTGARETDNIAAKRMRYALHDRLGSATLETDAAGQVTSVEEFFPYGGTAWLAGRERREVTIKETRFAGSLRDDATGFYCFEFRHYAPWIGNWICPDPSGAVDGLNLYRYARCNPVRYVDPSGLDPVLVGGLGGAGSSVRQAAFSEDGREAFTAAARRVTAITLTNGARVSVRLAGVRAIRDGDQFVRWWAEYDRIDTPPPPPADEGTEGGGGNGGEADRAGGDGGQSAESGGGQQSAGGGGQPGGGADAGEGDSEEEESSSGAGDAGTGTGAGESGSGPGGGGTGETAGTGEDGSGNGAGSGEGDGNGDGTGTEGGRPGGTGEAGQTGEGRGPPGSSGQGTTGTDGNGAEDNEGQGIEGGARGGRGRTPGSGDGPPTGDQSGGGGSEANAPRAPPDAPTSQDGIPWEEGAENPPPGAPEGEAGEGGGGSTPGGVPGGGSGTGGQGESPDPRPGGQGGSGGTPPEGGGGTESEATPGAGGQGGGNGNGASGSGGRGLKGGMGTHELPSWLSWVDPALDAVQVGLDIVGLIPGLGEIADGINGLVSLARGDYIGAGLSFAAMIPFAGWAATAGKFGRRAVRTADAVSDVGGAVLRFGDDAAGAGRAAYNTVTAAPGASRHTQEQIVDALRGANHTPTSQAVLDAIDNGDLALKLDPTHGFRGSVREAGEMVLNNSHALDDVVSTVVHEGRHALDIADNVIPPAGPLATQSDHLFGELRAWFDEVDFQALNNMTPSHTEVFRGLSRDAPSHVRYMADQLENSYDAIKGIAAEDFRRTVNRFLGNDFF